MSTKLKGVGAALITPFNEDLSIDFDGLKKVIDFISNEGCDYLVVNGTTGESATTTAAEKAELLAFVKANNPKNLPLVYGAGGNNTAAVIEHIKNTDFEGVEALLSVCPYYNKPPQAGLIAHFEAIADASPVPVILYNVPGRTVTSLSLETILHLAKHPNIIALKDATSSLEQAMTLTYSVPKDFILLSGDDNLVTPQVSMGYQGVISVIANGFPKEFHEMTWAALNGDFEKAAAYQRRFLIFDDLLYRESNPVGIKKVCAIRGLCDARLRLPLVEASKGLGELLEKAMKDEGFLA
ncbi:4-hydroxy-tetrahydrodipicolinate synthase [Jiulongibacter sediminis]|uniref:4-hydroxy-tetrahydrodipicolinate synthase n=1 Tax=Jiulongibacter sediminis TaxID=1605367 RepID=A0A0P7C6Z7_9BACT|nr:4-hydroxy-tetrahydrodipicolinate synthase [Jiulongibacter sediminis]KPM49214.1 dihydrodipicolinate synthase [Jiulongibacter sediminis]TBX26269.1 dihydrodipicolinate synthase [Jiulongibacter sediminis]